MKVKQIPIKAAKKIAEDYGYNQVVIIARATGKDGLESVTTYGINKENCSIAAKTGNFIKYKLMNWDIKKNLLYGLKQE